MKEGGIGVKESYKMQKRKGWEILESSKWQMQHNLYEETGRALKAQEKSKEVMESIKS